MRMKELLQNSKVNVTYYGLKDSNGVLFYNKHGSIVETPRFNDCVDNFILNPSAKILLCLHKCESQISELLVDYFPEDDVLDVQDLGGFIFITLQ